MATAAVLAHAPMPAGRKPSFKPIIENNVVKRKLDATEFDPKEHLAFQPPEEIIMMKDIGYGETTGVSPVAVSQPFQLFAPETIQKFRDEILQPEVMDKYLYKSNLAACQVRGYAAKCAPFTYDAWTNPNTLSIISKIAGVELIPNINFEIGHINISVKSEDDAREELDAIERERKSHADDEGIAGCPWEDDKPVVGWHTDSYPFVCVTMLSDCTNMVGGETALLTGNGDIMKVRGPQMGCAVIMQGRYITHQALRALGAQERITMVTSFRPKSPHLPDDSVLSTTRGISDLSELYYEFGSYRLAMLEERIRVQLKKLHDDHAAGKRTNTKALKSFLDEQEKFIAHTNGEMVQDELVKAGHQPEMDLPNVQTPPSSPDKADREAKRVKTA